MRYYIELIAGMALVLAILTGLSWWDASVDAKAAQHVEQVASK